MCVWKVKIVGIAFMNLIFVDSVKRINRTLNKIVSRNAFFACQSCMCVAFLCCKLHKLCSSCVHGVAWHGRKKPNRTEPCQTDDLMHVIINKENKIKTFLYFQHSTATSSCNAVELCSHNLLYFIHFLPIWMGNAIGYALDVKWLSMWWQTRTPPPQPRRKRQKGN